MTLKSKIKSLKFGGIFILLSFIILAIPAQVEAKINWPWQIRQEVRQEIKEQVQEQFNLTGTPPAWPTAKEARKELRQEIQEQIKEKLGWLLPAGFNQGELKSILGTTPPTDLVITKDSKDITVKVTTKTILLRKFGGKSDLAEFSVGDTLMVRGRWTDEAKTTIEARVIRNISIQKRRGTFWGTIKSKAENSFVLSSKNRGDQTVYLNGSPKIVNRKEETITSGDLQVSHQVRVTGLWDSKLNKITEVTRIKDWSIPPKVTPTP